MKMEMIGIEGCIGSPVSDLVYGVQNRLAMLKCGAPVSPSGMSCLAAMPPWRSGSPRCLQTASTAAAAPPPPPNSCGALWLATTPPNNTTTASSYNLLQRTMPVLLTQFCFSMNVVVSVDAWVRERLKRRFQHRNPPNPFNFTTTGITILQFLAERKRGSPQRCAIRLVRRKMFNKKKLVSQGRIRIKNCLHTLSCQLNQPSPRPIAHMNAQLERPAWYTDLGIIPQSLETYSQTPLYPPPPYRQEKAFVPIGCI